MSTTLPIRNRLPAWKRLPVREDWDYIRPGAGSESPFRDRPVTGSHLFGSAVCCVLGWWKPHLLFGFRPWTLVGDLWLSCDQCCWHTMLSGTNLPVMDQAEAASAARSPLPGTFRGFGLNLQSDRLYDLDSAIPDVIGLRAIQPDAAVIKVMSIPDNRCIRVVIPDDRVPNEFHEILIHDMKEEEPPFVALSDLGFLHLDWPGGLINIYGTLSVGSRTTNAPGVQGAFRIHTIRIVYILWQVHSAESGPTWCLLSHGFGTTVAVPGDLVYCVEGHTP